MYAVDLEYPGIMLSSPFMPSEPLRREYVEELGGKFLEGVSLTVPQDVQKRTEADRAPDAVLSVSESDPNHYEVIKYWEQIGPRGFRDADRIYGLLKQEAGWETFLRHHRILAAIAAEASGVEATDSPENPPRLEAGEWDRIA